MFLFNLILLKFFFFCLFGSNRLSNSSSFTELQFLNAAASRRAAVAAAAGLPSGGPNQNGGVSAPTPQRPEYHPAYRIPSYMDLYSLQHATSPQLHGEFFIFFWFVLLFKT